MAMTKDSSTLATDFINLKARVKAEMNRRNGSGPLTGYAAAAYDYTVVPTVGTVTINEEHFDKIRDTMTAINPATVGLPAKAVGDIVVAMNVLEANMSTFEAKPRAERSVSDCSAGCSGMCISTCTTTCSGCTGCGDACSSNCDGCSGCSGCGDACSTCTSCTGCSGCGTACSTCTSCTGCSGCGAGCPASCFAGCAAQCVDGGCWSACYGGGNACSTCTGTAV